MTLTVIGDSITRGTYFSEKGSGSASPCFAEILKEELGFERLYKYGFDAVSISQVSPVSKEFAFSHYIAKVEKADVLIVAAGTNDYGNNVPIGKVTDNEDVSFYGALYILAENIKRKFFDSLVIIVLPIKRLDEEKKNSVGHTLEEYRIAMRKFAEKHGFFVVNGKEIPIDPEKEEHRNLYIYDGLHPNTEGHKIYAKYLIERIKEVI